MLLSTLFDLSGRSFCLHFIELVAINVGFADNLTFSKLSYFIETHHLLHLFLAHMLVHLSEFASITLVLLLLFPFLIFIHLLLGQSVLS